MRTFVVFGKCLAEQKLSFAVGHCVWLFFAAYLLAGYSVFQKIAEHFLEKIFLDGNVLLVITTICAFAVGYYVEAVAVILIFQVGHLIEMITIDRSKRRIRELIDVHAILDKINW